MPQSWDWGERGPVIDIFWCRVCHYRVSQYTGTFAFPSHTQMVMHPSCRRFNFSYYIVADKGPKMVIWFAGRPMNMNHDQFISCHVVKTREDPYTIVHPSQSFVCDQFMVLVLMGSKLVKLINPIDNISGVTRKLPPMLNSKNKSSRFKFFCQQLLTDVDSFYPFPCNAMHESKVAGYCAIT